jgi:hypothetical protein
MNHRFDDQERHPKKPPRGKRSRTSTNAVGNLAKENFTIIELYTTLQSNN